MENGSVVPNGDEDDHHNRDDEEKARVLKEKNGVNGSVGHKRSLSGSILSKLSFLRTNQDEDEPAHSLRQTDHSIETDAQHTPSAAMVAAIQQHKKTRKRKLSLRKTALLGTGRLRLEGRERRGSNLEQVISLYGTNEGDSHTFNKNNINKHDIATSLDLSPKSQTTFDGSSSMPSKFPYQNGHIHSSRQGSQGAEFLNFVPPATSPAGDTSTTDEDDMITFPRAVSSVTAVLPIKKPSSSGSDSYFPPQNGSMPRRRSSNKPKSPLGALTSEATAATEDWDYSETEWWGWVVLVVTWVVFVVGMGSCFGVWSWAWDVGETPYAPPELEDDPTLPIVGYYPALIILTAVMAWVWVVVAWVGMKYFKHAKISGEDT
ncbi:hypothetical protein MMC16_002977 [Acarospora aff. strigata]|nr:hypothetical protein [Acarospora aff. strigata]